MFVAHYLLDLDVAIKLNISLHPSKRMGTAEMRMVYNEEPILQAITKEECRIYKICDKLIYSKVTDSPEVYAEKLKTFVQVYKNDFADISSTLARLVSTAFESTMLKDVCVALYDKTVHIYYEINLEHHDAHQAMEARARA